MVTEQEGTETFAFSNYTKMENIVIHSNMFCWDGTIYQAQCLLAINS